MSAVTQEQNTDFQSLAQQLGERKTHVQRVPEANLSPDDIGGRTPEASPEEKETHNSNKKFVFRKGEQAWDLDDDAEIEFVADKAPVKMTLRELKDRAAGDVAVKNRMHTLAEEKKKVQATLKEFTSLAKRDPVRALEYISNKAKEADSEFSYDRYLKALADQAERMGQMNDSELKAYKAEKRLEEVEKDLSQAQKTEFIRQKAQVSAQRLGITESQFNQAATRVLSNPDLMDSIENEDQFFGTVSDLVVEARAQKKIESAINRVDPSEVNNKTLVYELSDLIQQNPDFTEADIQDIVRTVLAPKIKSQAERRLSDKQRSSLPLEHLRRQGASEYELLVEQLKEKRQQANRR